MVASIRDLSYEERLERIHLAMLKKRRERGDLIAIYKAYEGVEEMDWSNLMVWDTWDTRGHGKKLKRSACRRDIKKYSFPYRSIDVRNSLDEEIVNAESIHQFRAKLDIKRYGDGTAQA
ncbi:uncharacterized protein LOC135101043 [Scylla paramamosain]|uniref:uncharacterized protein LOC135101043 n=1 Tax=Scylla paramamosain TaxID=85552 RepID=UPI0030828CF0